MTYTYDGDDLATVRTESVELVERADHASIGAGGFTIDDVAGTLRIVGHKGITGTEPFVGYVGPSAGTSRDREPRQALVDDGRVSEGRAARVCRRSLRRQLVKPPLSGPGSSSRPRRLPEGAE